MKIIAYDHFKPGVAKESIKPNLLKEEMTFAWRLQKASFLPLTAPSYESTYECLSDNSRMRTTRSTITWNKELYERTGTHAYGSSCRFCLPAIFRGRSESLRNHLERGQADRRGSRAPSHVFLREPLTRRWR
jgi:hypothetical protein